MSEPLERDVLDVTDAESDRPVVAAELPSAESVAAYEQVLPGAADRILTMLEQQTTHRMEMERTLVEAAARTERIGQVLGLGFVLVVFVIATSLITGGYQVPGTLLAVVDLVLLITVFLGRDRGASD